MTATLIAIDSDRLDRLEAEMRALRQALQGATVIPAPEWCGMAEACKRLACSADTIRRKARSGEIEARGTGRTRQFRIIPS